MYCQVCFEEFYLEYFSIEHRRHLFEYFVPLGNTGYCDGFSPNDSKKNRLDIRRFPQWKIKDNSKRKTKFSDRITKRKLNLLNTPD
jgi:hypothetical protein